MGTALDLDLACHVNVLVPDAAPERLDPALAVLARLGFRRAVLPPIDPSGTDLAAIAAVFRSHGLAPITIAGQAPGADISSDDPGEAAAGAVALRATLAATVALGGDQMNGVPYGLFGSPGAATSTRRIERAAKTMGEIADEAHECGVMMTFEVLNRYETSVVNTAEQAMALAELSGSPRLKIHLDTFHMAVEEADLSAAIRTALPRLGFLELGQSGRGMLATGAVDVPTLIAQALADGYEGRWGVEAFSRSILTPEAADMLAIWRRPYTGGEALAADAVDVVRFALTRAR
ncbi:sugar phosphate isomerase/epimerase family protein [Microbacterium sp.]|uniref:sugar phosphate isomerase/epimerase family protein n=1 Tax=Microbacterium sp. TaxID=51671 RepID=UPI003A85C1FB